MSGLEAPDTDTLAHVAPTTAVTGTRVGVGEHGQCSRCKRTIGAGCRVAVHCYAMSDVAALTVSRTVCDECADRGIDCPTLGATEYLVSAVVATRSNSATQSHTLVLVAGEIVDRSPPEEGSQP